MSDLSTDLAALFTTETLRAPEDSIGFLLWRIAHRHQREVDRAVVDLNLTHLQFVILVTTAWLSRTATPVMQVELAQFSRVHPMQLSNILKTLEQKQFIVRSRSRADTRTKQAEITAGGIAVLHRVLPLVKTIQQRMFGDIDEAAKVHTMLRRIVTQLGDD